MFLSPWLVSVTTYLEPPMSHETWYSCGTISRDDHGVTVSLVVDTFPNLRINLKGVLSPRIHLRSGPEFCCCSNPNSRHRTNPERVWPFVTVPLHNQDKVTKSMTRVTFRWVFTLLCWPSHKFKVMILHLRIVIVTCGRFGPSPPKEEFIC